MNESTDIQFEIGELMSLILRQGFEASYESLTVEQQAEVKLMGERIIEQMVARWADEEDRVDPIQMTALFLSLAGSAVDGLIATGRAAAAHMTKGPSIVQ